MLRLYMLTAKLWQQLVICATFIAVGVVVLALGSLTGLLPIIFGVILSVPAASILLRRARMGALISARRGRNRFPEGGRPGHSTTGVDDDGR